jgi:MFS transporter, CP family, cyanate transporter
MRFTTPDLSDRPGSLRDPDRHRWLIVAAIVLTGLTMRVAVSSVGAVLDDAETGLGLSSGAAGVITTLPVIAFAGIGYLGPRLAHRLGEHRVLAAALLAATIGLALRATAGGIWSFGLLSMLTLAGGALANVLMPALVKRHFPDRIGTMTAVYTTALAIGTTTAAGLTVPIADLGGHNWRFGIGSWAALTLLAILPWLPSLPADRPTPDDQPARIPVSRMARSRLAWALALLFGSQSFQAYIAFGWFANFFRHHHIAATEAGLLVAFYSGLSIPISIVIPTLAVRRQRPLVALLALAAAASYVGMLLAPAGGAWLWMLLGGIGSGMFPLSLTMIGLRSRAAGSTAALSAFVQSAGYLLAGTGPLLVGLLLDLTDDWTWPLLMLLVAAALSAGFGWYAGRPRYVDDELAVAGSTTRQYPG